MKEHDRHATSKLRIDVDATGDVASTSIGHSDVICLLDWFSRFYYETLLGFKFFHFEVGFDTSRARA